jgi:micrococcal nuclease
MGSKPTTLNVNDIVYDDTVPFIPSIKEARVIKVYDGDTFTIGFYQSGSDIPYRMSVRLTGIDAPELKTKSLKGRAAQSLLKSLIMGKVVVLSDVSVEKYGRLLADVHCEGLHINQLMIDSRLAILYDGGRKTLNE